MNDSQNATFSYANHTMCILRAMDPMLARLRTQRAKNKRGQTNSWQNGRDDYDFERLISVLKRLAVARLSLSLLDADLTQSPQKANF